MTFSVPAMAIQETVRPEPPLNSLIDWDIYPNGMLVVSYDITKNGRPDYFTLRIISATIITRESVKTVAKNNVGNVVFSAYTGGKVRVVYITARYPHFYAIDANEDGVWDVIYKDVLQDGVNGNEVFYDSPSETYSPWSVNE